MAPCLIVCLVLSCAGLQAQSVTRSLAERLGYAATDKLLIIHADDLAVAHAENRASFRALEEGVVNSASVMVPCPWLPEVAEYARNHPNHDFGLHLTLTSEWKWYKWGPAAPRHLVKGLVDSLGYFYDNCADVAQRATAEEVETELRAQVQRAKAMGLKPTHLDSHMGCLFFGQPSYLAAYMRVARDNRIPAMLNHEMVEGIILRQPQLFEGLYDSNTVVVDHIHGAVPGDFTSGMADYYRKLLRDMKPGVNVLLIHVAYDNLEMQGVSHEHPDWGAAWRQADFDFFTSREARELLRSQNIRLITWREIGKLLNP